MVPEAPQSPPDLIEDEVSGTDLAGPTLTQRGHSSMATWPLGSTVYEMS